MKKKQNKRKAKTKTRKLALPEHSNKYAELAEQFFELEKRSGNPWPENFAAAVVQLLRSDSTKG